MGIGYFVIFEKSAFSGRFNSDFFLESILVMARVYLNTLISILPRSKLFSIFKGRQIGGKCPYWANLPILPLVEYMDLGKMHYKGIQIYHGHDKNRFEKKLELKRPENVDFSNISTYPIHFL